MSELKREYLAYIDAIEACGASVLTFDCPSCNEPIKTLTPSNEGEYWNSFSQCPHCEDMFLKDAYFGHVEVRKLEPYPNEANA